MARIIFVSKKKIIKMEVTWLLTVTDSYDDFLGTDDNYSLIANYKNGLLDGKYENFIMRNGVRVIEIILKLVLIQMDYLLVKLKLRL